MTVEEKREAIESHCESIKCDCEKCILQIARDRGVKISNLCFTCKSELDIDKNYNLIFGPEAADERGANNMDKETIIIDLERYDELIKKEAIYDRLTASSDVNMYLVPRLEEVKTNA